LKEFAIAPGGASNTLIFTILAIVMLGVAAMMVSLAMSSKQLRFEVGPSGLSIKDLLYGRTIPYSHLDISQAEQLNLDASSYRLKWRRNGSSLPGFKAGWFTLRNGEKALVFLTDPTRAVRVPTRDGYQLIVSPDEPQAFLAALEDAATSDRLSGDVLDP